MEDQLRSVESLQNRERLRVYKGFYLTLKDELTIMDEEMRERLFFLCCRHLFLTENEVK